MTTVVNDKPLTVLEVSVPALVHNISEFQRAFPKHKIIPVIKSNAYGAGVTVVLDAIKNKIDQVAVVSTTEAIQIRKLIPHHRITVLSILEPQNIKQAIQQDIEIPIYNEYWLNTINKISKEISKPAKIHIKIDTGTHRVGFTPDMAPTIISNVIKNPNTQLVGVFSHYAASEELPEFTTNQTDLFDKIINNLNIPLNTQIHMACSAASTVGAIPKTTNAIRLGLSLYGYWPSDLAKEQNQTITLQPTLTWKTKIIHIQHLNANEPIGYGCSYTTTKPSIIATIPVGYFDGLDRGLSNQGSVLIKGTLCPIVGRVCMNLTMVDITDVPKTNINDEVVILGKQQNNEITPEEMAKQLGTINYEIISRIAPHIPRIAKQ